MPAQKSNLEKIDCRNSIDIELDFLTKPNHLIELVPYSFCFHNKCLPFELSGRCLYVLSVEKNINITQEFKNYLDFGYVKQIPIKTEELMFLIEISYANNNWSDIEHLDVDTFINRILAVGIVKGASDIHLSIYIDTVILRYRINNRLIKVLDFSREYYEKLLIKMKILFTVDITVCFKDRDGSFCKEIKGKRFDFRASFYQCVDGENVVIRILKQISKININELGYDSVSINLIKQTVDKKVGGLILFVGPTGSGKTTSMYALINSIDFISNNIITIENPIECRLPFVQQVDLNQHPDLNFANSFRSILRQDPDYIMIGEIRDEETAKISVRAANSGHKILSTIHASTVFGVIDRFVDFGVKKQHCIESIMAVISQRLVNRKGDYFGSRQVLLYEVIIFTDDVKKAIAADISHADRFKMLKDLGCVLFQDNANKLVENGFVDKDEIDRYFV